AVSDLVSAHLPPEVVKVKWPNDVLVRGAKIAGILVESGCRDDGRLWLAIGVGVNLTSAPADPERPATAIGPAAPSPEDALAYLADRFTVWERIWRDYGFEAIAPAWTNHAYGLGEPCVARLSNEEIQGVAEGLEPDGALRLRLPNGELRRITAGDVFF
ncbi:MAG: biotin--[acetyl-CoA-carboxylase] ligase, partial [Caulobacteraceae bacterium]